MESFQKQHGSDRVAFVAGDITDPATSKTAVETAISKFGQLNAVIANAGVLDPIGPIENTSVDQWKQLYDINVFSVVELIKHSLPHLKKPTVKSLVFHQLQPLQLSMVGMLMVLPRLH